MYGIFINCYVCIASYGVCVYYVYLVIYRYTFEIGKGRNILSEWCKQDRRNVHNFERNYSVLHI